MSLLAMEMSEAEKHKILVEWNNTYTHFPLTKNLPQLFEEQVKNNPEHVALHYNQCTLTYKQVNEKANQVAHYLQNKKIGQGEIIAFCIKPSFELIITILGILKAGCAYIPLDPSNPRERQRILLEESKAKFLLTEAKFVKNFKNNSIQKYSLDEEQSIIAKYDKDNLSINIDSNSLAYVIFTSGSTGKPKGAMLSHRNVNNFIHWFGEALGNNYDDIFDFSSSISFDFSVACTLFPLLTGSEIVICDEEKKKDPFLYVDHLIQSQVSIVKITPSHFRQFKEVVFSKNVALNLRYIIFGGEPLFAYDIKDWIAKFPKQTLFCEYGPTETTVACSWIKINKTNLHQYDNKIPIGKPAANTQLFILNKNMEPIPTGEIGELYVGGEGVGLGYLNNAENTIKKFVDTRFNTSSKKLYKTGDLCRFLTDGNIEFIERIDNQIKIRGFRVELGEIEECILKYEYIKNAVVLAKPINQTSEKLLISYCVAKNNFKLENFKNYLLDQLPVYMIPRIIMVDGLPLNANGKLDRQALSKAALPTNHKIKLPKSSIAKSLKNIWLQELHLTEISIDDNFFDVGGNSLIAARIIIKIRNKLHKEISLKDFYEASNINDLAKIIDKKNYVAQHSLINEKNILSYKNLPLNELQFLFWVIKRFYSSAKVLNIVNRKRLNGKLDTVALNYALNKLLEKHSILNYRISSYFPMQIQDSIKHLKLLDYNIQNLTSAKQESILLDSYNHLEHFKWNNRMPYIALRLFQLAPDSTELQLAISHFISDEISMNLIWHDLSIFYLEFLNKQPSNNVGARPNSYAQYVFFELESLEKNLQKDIEYWQAYLKTTYPLIFTPNQFLSPNEKFYTSYSVIPETVFENLKWFCTYHHLSFADSICAAIGIAFYEYIQSDNKTIALNLVKSNRVNPEFDKTVGLFVKTDLIKIDLKKHQDLLTISKQVQQTIKECAAFQTCPTIVKLACLFSKEWSNKKFSHRLFETLATIYTRFFPQLKLNPLILFMLFKVFLARKSHDYLIDVNIMNTLFTENKTTNFFDLETIHLKNPKADKLVEDKVINVWLDKDAQNNCLLIISTKLGQVFRENLANKIIETLRNIS